MDPEYFSRWPADGPDILPFKRCEQDDGKINGACDWKETVEQFSFGAFQPLSKLHSSWCGRRAWRQKVATGAKKLANGHVYMRMFICIYTYIYMYINTYISFTHSYPGELCMPWRHISHAICQNTAYLLNILGVFKVLLPRHSIWHTLVIWLTLFMLIWSSKGEDVDRK